jgi:hypothetical protein
MKRTLTTARAFCICLALTGAGAGAQSKAEPVPVLLELFTSEGCNSCPPADRILEMLSKEQPMDGVYIVAMSEHVTYWDHQGWRDPFGAQRFTQRQNAYGSTLKLESVYTPQLIIDGTTELVGSDTAKLKAAVAGAGAKPKPRLAVEVSWTPDGAVNGSVTGPGLDAAGGEPAELMWALTEDDLVVEVKRGENANRTLRHSGVVRSLTATKLQSRKGIVTGTVINVQPEWKREHLRLIAFVQATKSKRVLSVGWARLQGQ